MENVNISCVRNVWIRQVELPTKGDVVLTHAHSHDHQTLLASGKVMAYVDDKNWGEFTAPKIIVIRAGQHHCFEALADNTVLYCIHAIRDGERVEDIIAPDSNLPLQDASPLVKRATNTQVERG